MRGRVRVLQAGLVSTTLLAAVLWLPLPALAVTSTWDGGGLDADWSTSQNWAGDIAPTTNDNVVFPSGTAQSTVTNDLGGTTFASVAVTGAGYSINGAPIRLNDALSAAAGTGVTTIASEVEAAFDLDLVAASAATLDLAGDLDLNGLPVKIAGAGRVNLSRVVDASVTNGTVQILGPGSVRMTGVNTGQGGASVAGGALEFNGVDAPNSVTLVDALGTLTGTGTMYEVDAAGVVDPGAIHAAGRLSVNRFALNQGPGDEGTLRVDINGATAGTSYDQLATSSAPELSDAALSAVVGGGFLPPIGSTYVIVDNGSGSPVVGTFAGLPEGATVNSAGTTFTISYAGGTGNDVALTAVQSVGFSPATLTVAEDAGTASLSIARSGGTGGTVGVSYAVSGGTAGPGDFALSSGTVTFANAESLKTVVVTITDDSVIESDETLVVELSAPTGGATLGAATTWTLTITENDAPAPTTTTTTTPGTTPPPPVIRGYRMVGEDGGVFNFGEAGFHGSLGAQELNGRAVDIVRSRSGKGYWALGSDGGVFAFGDAGFQGSAGSMRLNSGVVAGARTPSGKGYWLVAGDGGVFNYGDARFHGAAAALPLRSPVVDIVATLSGDGYWLVAADGGVFSYGDARFYGSTGGIALNAPVVAAVRSSSGGGYWLVAADGGVFGFGDALFHGSAANLPLQRPIVDVVGSADGNGYWLVADDGGVFSYGDAGFYGSTGGVPLNAPIVGGA